MNILIVKLSAIGDVVHTLPSLSALRRLYPSAKITWVIEETAADLIVGNPYLHRVIISRRKKWFHELKKGNFSVVNSIKQFIGELRREHFDLVIDFHGLFKSAMLVFLSRATIKLGYDSMQELSGLFLTHKVYEDKGKHAVCRYLDLVRYLVDMNIGKPRRDVLLEDEKAEFPIPVGKEEEEKIKALMAEQGLREGQFIAISPHALWATKLWEAEKFARLAGMIYREIGLDVVFTGAHTYETKDIIERLTIPFVDLTGKTSLKELALLFRKARAVISTDSGPMHIAAAMKTPVVALFGPTDPKRTGPYGNNNAVVTADISCRPCFLKRCEKKTCMHLLTERDVVDALKRVL